MPSTYIPVLPLLTGGSVVGSSMETVLNGVLNFIQSPAFFIIIAILALLLVAWSVMVGHGHHMIGAEHADILVSECVERLRCGHLMTVEAVDIKLCGTILHLLYYVGVPDLIE